MSVSLDQITFKRPSSLILSNLQNMFVTKKHVDVTFRVEGQLIEAHRVVLCASSPYFDELLTKCQLNFPDVIPLNNFKFHELKTLIQYMYWGEVTVSRESVPSLMETASALKMALMEDSLMIAGPSSGQSEDIFITNSISDQSILVDCDPIPPNAMRPPAVHEDDVIDRQEGEEAVQNVGGLMDEQEPLDDDNPERELNLTDKDFSLHLSEDEQSLVSHVEELSADRAETQPLEAKRKRNCNKENQDIENGSSSWADSSDEEATVSSIPRRSQPKLIVRTNQKGAKRTTTSASNKSPCIAAESNEENNKDTEDETSISTDDSSDEGTTHRSSTSRRRSQSKRGAHQKKNRSATGNLEKKGKAHRGSSGCDGSSSGLFECKVCGRSYTLKTNLTRHIKFECNKDPSFVCDLCGHSTFRKWDLKTHLFRVHKINNSQRFYKCNKCPFRDRQIEVLRKHKEKRHNNGQ